MRPSAPSDVSLEFTELLLSAEQQWDIRAEVAKEWGPTFDRLLSFYNTQDITSIITTFMRNTVSEMNTNDKLPIKELRKWIKPKFEPPTWKKLFRHSEYKRHKRSNVGKFESLFGGIVEAENNTFITRAQFIDRIMEELRDGNKNVYIFTIMLLIVFVILAFAAFVTYVAGCRFFEKCFPSFGKGRILLTVATTMVFGDGFPVPDYKIRVSQSLL